MARPLSYLAAYIRDLSTVSPLYKMRGVNRSDDSEFKCNAKIFLLMVPDSHLPPPKKIMSSPLVLYNPPFNISK